MTTILTLVICFGVAALGTALIWLALRFLTWCFDQIAENDIP